MKKSIYLLFVLMLLAFVSKAQEQQNRLPMQGVIYQNGEVMNGSINLQVNIPELNYVENHYNTQVVNSLWNIIIGGANNLPNNFWNGRDSLIINISANGTPLSPQVIYPVLERDPNLPEFLNDGEITYSDIKTPFAVGEARIETIADTIQFLHNSSYSNDTIWQVFVPNHTGSLKQLIINISNAHGTDFKLKFFKGTDISGQSIYDNTYPSSTLQAGTGMQTIDINSQTNIHLEKGDPYTYMLVGLNNDLIYSYSDENPYLYGYSNINENADFTFINVMELATGVLMTHENGNLINHTGGYYGINGPIIFPGEIVMSATSVAPSGWLICDGSEVSRIKYADLFNSIGIRYGAGDGVTTFNLPDTRGYFVRGFDQGAGNDPDVATRHALYNGSILAYQNDKIKSHKHQQTTNAYDWDTSYSWGTHSNGSVAKHADAISSAYTQLTGGSETRPKNINFFYLIKY